MECSNFQFTPSMRYQNINIFNFTAWNKGQQVIRWHNGQASPSWWKLCHFYHFPPQLPFIQVEYEWEETGTPSSSWPTVFICFSSFHVFCETVPFTTTRRCNNCGNCLPCLQGLKRQYLKYLIIFKNCHHNGSNSRSREHTLKQYIFLS